MPNIVAKQAEVVLPIDLVTEYGPTRFTPFALAVSAASTFALEEPPPEPTIKPTLGSLISSKSKPASLIACCIEIKLNAAASLIKRFCLRPINSSTSIFIRPAM